MVEQVATIRLLPCQKRPLMLSLHKSQLSCLGCSLSATDTEYEQYWRGFYLDTTWRTLRAAPSLPNWQYCRKSKLQIHVRYCKASLLITLTITAGKTCIREPLVPTHSSTQRAGDLSIA